jgi:outer membrane protein assembly factor BamB
MELRTRPLGLAVFTLLAWPAASLAQGVAHGRCEPLKITAPDARPSDYMGHACLSSDVLVSASPAVGLELGTLYVFDRATGAMQLTLEPSEAELGDGFGFSVAIDGRHAVAGAPEHDLSGMAYVFDVHAGQELLALRPSDPLASMAFGASVAIDGQWIVVGAPGHYPFPPSAGAVYVFDRLGGALLWRLAPPDLSFGFPDFAFFGTSVSLDRGLVLAGAPGDAPSGSAYLFDAQTGAQLSKWTPPATPVPGGFGGAVSLHGERAAVADNEAGGNRGAVHVFDVASGQRLFTVQAPDAEPGDNFGTSVALDGRFLVVGAYLDDDPPFNGSVYVFRAVSGEFVAKLHGYRATATESFGSSVHLFEHELVVSDSQDNEAALYAGAAYIVPLAPCR